MNLVFALIWLVVAVGGLVGWWLNPEQPLWRIGGTGLPIGLVAVCFVAYNLARWYADRAARQRRQQRDEPPPWRRRREDERRYELPPDPTFDFTDRPPPPGGPNPPGR